MQMEFYLNPWLGYVCITLTISTTVNNMPFNHDVTTSTITNNLVFSRTNDDDKIEYFDCVYMYSQKVYCEWLVSSDCLSWKFHYGLKDYHTIHSPEHHYNCSDVNQKQCDVSYGKCPKLQQKCNQVIENTDCDSIDYKCFHDYKTYIFQIRGVCNDKTTATASFVVPINESLVKMEPVKYAKVYSSPHNMTIKWTFETPPFYYDSMRIICQVLYWTTDQEFTYQNETIEYRNDVVRKRLNNIVPGAQYNIRVRCHPKYSIIWSDFVDLQARSGYVVPLSGAEMTSDGFVLGYSWILIYLKVPDGYLAQGNITQVKIELKDFNTNCVQSTIVNRTETVLLNTCGSNSKARFKVEATVRNSVGWSYNLTTLEIHPKPDLLQPEDIVVEADKETGYVNISLEKIFNDPVNLTYYWCVGTKDESNRVICLENLQWVLSTNSSLSWKFPRRDFDSLKFGVALSIAQYSSGVVWADCLFKQIIKEFHVMKPKVIEIGFDSVAVMIPTSFCQVLGYRPLYYILHYKQHQDVTWRNSTILARRSTSNITLTNITPGTVYEMVYYTQYRFGKGPKVEFNYPKSGVRSETGSDRNMKIMYGVIPVLVVFVIVLGISFRKKIAEVFKAVKNFFAQDEIWKVEIEVGNRSVINEKTDLNRMTISNSNKWKNESEKFASISDDYLVNSLNEVISSNDKTITSILSSSMNLDYLKDIEVNVNEISPKNTHEGFISFSSAQTMTDDSYANQEQMLQIVSLDRRKTNCAYSYEVLSPNDNGISMEKCTSFREENRTSNDVCSVKSYITADQMSANATCSTKKTGFPTNLFVKPDELQHTQSPSGPMSSSIENNVDSYVKHTETLHEALSSCVENDCNVQSKTPQNHISLAIFKEKSCHSGCIESTQSPCKTQRCQKQEKDLDQSCLSYIKAPESFTTQTDEEQLNKTTTNVVDGSNIGYTSFVLIETNNNLSSNNQECTSESENSYLKKAKENAMKISSEHETSSSTLQNEHIIEDLYQKDITENDSFIHANPTDYIVI